MRPLTPPHQLQLNQHGQLRHFLTTEGLSTELLTEILDTADSFVSVGKQAVKKVPLLRGKTVVNLFFEASTRTDMSFQAAMRRLGGEVIAASNGVKFSSMYKGENLADTVRAAGCYADAIVLRHPQVGSTYEAAYYLDFLNKNIRVRPVSGVTKGGDEDKQTEHHF